MYITHHHQSHSQRLQKAWYMKLKLCLGDREKEKLRSIYVCSIWPIAFVTINMFSNYYTDINYISAEQEGAVLSGHYFVHNAKAQDWSAPFRCFTLSCSYFCCFVSKLCPNVTPALSIEKVFTEDLYMPSKSNCIGFLSPCPETPTTISF